MCRFRLVFLPRVGYVPLSPALGLLSYFFLRTFSGLSQVREKIKALCARNAEFCSAIAILSHAASTLRSGRSQIASASVSDREASGAVATAASGGGVSLASVTQSLVQTRRLHKQFELRWGFVRNRTLGANIEVCVCVCVCMFVYGA